MTRPGVSRPRVSAEIRRQGPRSAGQARPGPTMGRDRWIEPRRCRAAMAQAPLPGDRPPQAREQCCPPAKPGRRPAAEPDLAKVAHQGHRRAPHLWKAARQGHRLSLPASRRAADLERRKIAGPQRRTALDPIHQKAHDPERRKIAGLARRTPLDVVHQQAPDPERRKIAGPRRQTALDLVHQQLVDLERRQPVGHGCERAGSPA